MGLTRTRLCKFRLRSRRGANNLGRLASSEAGAEAGARGVPAGGSCFGVKYGACFHVSPYESSITFANNDTDTLSWLVHNFNNRCLVDIGVPRLEHGIGKNDIKVNLESSP